MTEETCDNGLQVARLNRTQPPPGYVVVRALDGFGFTAPTGEARASSMDVHGHGWSRDTALARAWAHYEAENIPPGMQVFVWPKKKASDPPTTYSFDPARRRHVGEADEQARTLRFFCSVYRTEEQVIAAAWAWYWRRRSLASRLAHGPLAPLTCGCGRDLAADGGARPCAHADERRGLLLTEFWPRCLAWPDKDVIEVERWLDEGGKVPEALRN